MACGRAICKPSVKRVSYGMCAERVWGGIAKEVRLPVEIFAGELQYKDARHALVLGATPSYPTLELI